MASRHTTLRLSPALMRRVRAFAHRHRVTLTAVMERAIAEYLARPAAERAPRAVKLPSFSTGGTRAGVDLDRNARLLDVMDGLDWRHPVG